MSKTSDDGLRARMATLTKQKINELRAAYTRTTGKPANRLGRDALIKTLAASGADAAPAAKAPTVERKATTRTRDPRLPAPGATIEKTFKGKAIRVEATTDGFRHAGKDWSSLTALALSITGYKAISGPAFFGLTTPSAAPAKAKGAAKPKAKGD